MKTPDHINVDSLVQVKVLFRADWEIVRPYILLLFEPCVPIHSPSQIARNTELTHTIDALSNLK